MFAPALIVHIVAAAVFVFGLWWCMRGWDALGTFLCKLAILGYALMWLSTAVLYPFYSKMPAVAISTHITSANLDNTAFVINHTNPMFGAPRYGYYIEKDGALVATSTAVEKTPIYKDANSQPYGIRNTQQFVCLPMPSILSWFFSCTEAENPFANPTYELHVPANATVVEQ